MLPGCCECEREVESGEWGSEDVIVASYGCAKVACPYCEDGYFWIS